MLKDRRTYEIMRPEEVGVPEATLVLGKHSGRHAVQRRCEQIGVTLTRHELDQVYRAVITLADRSKVVNDADLRQIVGRLRDGSLSTALAGSNASGTTDFSLTPAESGYGHGV
jgi:2-isopropylmalate synthase